LPTGSRPGAAAARPPPDAAPVLPRSDEPGDVGDARARAGVDVDRIERLERQPQLRVRLGGRPGAAAALLDQAGRRLELGCGQLGPLEQAAQPGGALPARRERDGNGQRALALDEVAVDRLPGHGGVAPDAEQVVHGLERQPQVGAERTQAGHGRRIRAGEHRPDRGGALEQRAGLSGAHAGALLRRHVHTALEIEVGRLAVDQPPGCVCEQLDGGRPVRRRGGEQVPEGEREHGVAGQDRPRPPEHGPRRRPVMALLVVVHDVVVQERERVHELDRHRTGHAGGISSAGGTGREQGEGRPHGFAAPGRRRVPVGVEPAQVVADDGAHRRRELTRGGAQLGADGSCRGLEHRRERHSSPMT
jgi:hypothetical protein